MAVVDERLGAPIRQLRNHCAECGRNGGECQTHCQTLRRVCRQSLAQIAFACALVPYHLECFAGNQACQRWDCRLDELVAQRIRVVEPVLAQPVDLLVDAVQAVDRAVDSLHRIDEKVNRLREDRLNDPDSLGDKLIKSAVPALAGLVAGKAFQMIWDKGTSKRNLRKGLAADAPQSLAMSLAFAAVSAALGAVVSQLSDRGSKAFVDHRHRKPSR